MAKLQAHAVKKITEIVERYKNEETHLMMILLSLQSKALPFPTEKKCE